MDEELPGCRLSRDGRMSQVGAGHSLDFGDRVERQIDCFMSLAHGFSIRSRHEAEGLAFRQVDVCSVCPDAKPGGRLLERIELRKELRLGQLALSKAAFGFDWSVDEVLH